MNVNPKLALIPDFFINAVVKRVVNKMIISLRSKDVFDNDSIKKRIQDNPEKFELMKNCLREAGVAIP